MTGLPLPSTALQPDGALRDAIAASGWLERDAARAAACLAGPTATARPDLPAVSGPCYGCLQEAVDGATDPEAVRRAMAESGEAAAVAVRALAGPAGELPAAQVPVLGFLAQYAATAEARCEAVRALAAHPGGATAYRLLHLAHDPTCPARQRLAQLHLAGTVAGLRQGTAEVPPCDDGDTGPSRQDGAANPSAAVASCLADLALHAEPRWHVVRPAQFGLRQLAASGGQGATAAQAALARLAAAGIVI